MSTLNKVLILIIVILVVALAGFFYWQRGGISEQYHAVYLGSGDLYFGKLSRFPKMVLRDAWFLTPTDKNEKASFGLSDFSKALWGPKGDIYLNDDNIIWISPLRSDSKVVEAMKNPQAASAQAPGGNSQAPDQSAPSVPSLPNGTPTSTTE